MLQKYYKNITNIAFFKGKRRSKIVSLFFVFFLLEGHNNWTSSVSIWVWRCTLILDLWVVRRWLRITTHNWVSVCAFSWASWPITRQHMGVNCEIVSGWWASGYAYGFDCEGFWYSFCFWREKFYYFLLIFVNLDEKNIY